MMKDLNMYKAFIFDLDNTLYNYDYCDYMSYAVVRDYVVKEYKITLQQFENLLEEAKENTKQINPVCHNRLVYFQYIAEKLGNKDIIKSSLKMFDIYSKCFYKNMKPFDWVVPFFKSHKCYICTNMTTEVQFQKLLSLGISEYIAQIVTSEEVNAEKPDIKIYDTIYDKISKSVKLEDILFVGDDMVCDVVGPDIYGFDAIHVNLFKEVLNEYSNWKDQ